MKIGDIVIRKPEGYTFSWKIRCDTNGILYGAKLTIEYLEGDIIVISGMGCWSSDLFTEYSKLDYFKKRLMK